MLLFAPNLSGGGAERILSRLANHWAERGHDVTVVTLAEASQEDFPVLANVHRIALGLTGTSRGAIGALRGNLRRVAALRQVLKDCRPNVVISFIEQANVLALLAARPLNIPVVISERTDPSRHRAGRVWEFLRNRVYHRCAALVVLTDDIAGQMRPILRGRPLFVIANGVAPPPLIETDREPIVVAVGRLDEAKGFDRLIQAFARIADQHPEWRLEIVGDGPSRATLEQLRTKCNLDQRVCLSGRTPDPSPHLLRASLFALTSRYEGFPNALLEAMAAGLPAVAFDGPPAVRSIVRDGIDGILVRDGDLSGFAAALGELMCDPHRRHEMGEAAREVSTRFSLSEFFRKWTQVISMAAIGDFSQPSGRKRE